jgi:hypothetical protein
MSAKYFPLLMFFIVFFPGCSCDCFPDIDSDDPMSIPDDTFFTGDDQQSDDETDDTSDDTFSDDDDSDDDAVQSELAPPPSDEIGVFVSINGNDDNPGTMAEPKLTIQAGVTQAQTDDKVVFISEGTWSEKVRTPVSLYGGYLEDWSRDAYSGTLIDLEFTLTDPTILTIEASDEPINIEGLSITSMNWYSLTLIRVESGAQVVIAGGNYIVWAPLVSQFVIVEDGAQAILVNNTLFLVNGSAIQAGVSLNTGSIAYLINNTFFGGHYGFVNYTGVAIADGAQAYIVNNIFVLRYTDEEGNSTGISLASGASALVAHNDILGGSGDCALYSGECRPNPETIDACDWPGCVQAYNNISADPMLFWWFFDDFEIPAFSPCANAGRDPSIWYSGPPIHRDNEGKRRPRDIRWDIGAYEAN